MARTGSGEWLRAAILLAGVICVVTLAAASACATGTAPRIPSSKDSTTKDSSTALIIPSQLPSPLLGNTTIG